MTRQAVIIGDLQAGITSGYRFAAELVPHAAALAVAARERGDLVVFVRTQFRASGADVSARNRGITAIFEAGGDYHEGSAGVELDPGLGRLPGDVVVTKRRASAFAGTDLGMVLGSGGIGLVCVAGVATSAMVAATVYDAADRDYTVRVVRDVCADPAPAVHDFFIGTVFPSRGVDVITSTSLGLS
ncbi:MAG: cysteine hydrolase [Streptosporangiaceae bacterium]|nr:cysteine hydrolase [Streptosporangiaceae bacterium]